MMNASVHVFVGFTLQPGDFLNEIEEVRRIDCGHDPDEEAKYCDECGTRLTKTDLKVQLKEGYKNQFDPPSEQYATIEERSVQDWLEYKAIRPNFDVETERASDPETQSNELVVGRCVQMSRPHVDRAEILSVPRQELEDAIDEVGEVLKSLDLEREVSLHIIERLN